MARSAVLGVLGVSALLGGLAGGCVLDPWAVRPTRAQVGPQMRSINVPGPQPISGSVQSTPATDATGPARSSERSAAASIDLQFTTRFGQQLYVGAEGEAGKASTGDADIGGAYAIVGIERAAKVGSVGAELATGWRGLRIPNSDAINRFLVEPRVRGQIWIAEQWSLGGTIGAGFGNSFEWMAGVFLGLHSNAF
jgi:hypothetical protein